MNKNIRNFVIIAHIDHGKSTLADRLLEVTGTVESRRMRPQYLDQLELERERGITIKMAPVRMNYESNGEKYILNLIDTPGHSDFSYEVSRALAAVEGAVLLVDVTKGIQAQTLSNLRSAEKAGLKIIGAVNKIDLNPHNVPRVVDSLADLLGVEKTEILKISGKTGEGVKELLEKVINEVPHPKDGNISAEIEARASIFDSFYDDHKGILAYIRVFEGELSAGDEVLMFASGARFRMKEVGCFNPELKPVSKLKAGEIGYLATGLKEPSVIRIGDTISKFSPLKISENEARKFALPGYRDPAPVVFISFYPDGTTKFEDLKKGFEKLRLTDAALNFEPDANDALGRGLKVGFLGQLHFEIIATRLEREFGLEFLTSFPSIAYRVKDNGVEKIVKEPHAFPNNPEQVWQPIIGIEILSPSQYMNQVINLKNLFDLDIKEVQNIGDNVLLTGTMPLSELIRDFDDQLKSVSAGFASFSYELAGESLADVEKLEILIAGEPASALTRIVMKKDVEREARNTVERLKDLLPAQQFSQALQAKVGGKIIARETIPAMKKELGNFGKNGGDRTRKMKLWKKQQEGKKRLQKTGRVNLSVEVFREILKK